MSVSDLDFASLYLPTKGKRDALIPPQLQEALNG